MNIRDLIRFSSRALSGYPLRTGLMLLAMAMGVASVVVLTALGEGARRYVAGQFTSLGTHILIVLPGRNETTGGPPPMMGETPRDLTIEDAIALKRSSTVRRVAPIMVGSAPVTYAGREREVMILGSIPIRSRSGKFKGSLISTSSYTSSIKSIADTLKACESGRLY